jgi:NADH:ubiquinone oxidoreductase subunit 6 (subunit J)
MNTLPVQIAFYSLTALTLISAAYVVRARSIIHAGFWLLPCFVGVAGLFATLQAHFFFVAQLLIYAGAILVLILFALMLTRDAMSLHVPLKSHLGVWAGLISAGLGISAAVVLTRQSWPVSGAQPADPARQAQALGEALIGLYAVPFEVASLLLLSALIGAVMLAKAERAPAPEPPPLADTLEEPEEPLKEPVGVE